MSACQRQVDTGRCPSDLPADGRFNSSLLNIVALQFVVVLRVQITHDIDTWLYLFHIRGVCQIKTGDVQQISGTYPVVSG